MTCNEIAVAYGVSAERVRAKAKACGFELKRGKGQKDFTKSEVAQIASALKVKPKK